MDYIWKDRKRIWCGLPWSFTKYKLTEERLFIETGVFTCKENECRLYRIMDLQLTRTLIQRVFNMGTITICSSDKSLGNFELKNIKNPKEVKELLAEKVEVQRDKKRVVNREIMDGEGEEDVLY